MLKRYEENDIILREGDTDTNLYKVLSGNVEVYSGFGTDRENILGILSEGDYFGEMGLLTGAPAIYTVIAYNNPLVLSVEKDDLFSYVKQNYSDLIAIMENMARSMLNMKKNIDLLTNDAAFLLKDRKDTKKAQELKQRITESDIRKAMIRYGSIYTQK
ncbi:MAG: cyclic nucleotide-binding domain-containing protein [Eubacterium sp.]|nr:cyclic nucleotide-binding domain-containing protein [Eubacterium sp.]